MWQSLKLCKNYRVVSHNSTSAILEYQKNETEAMLVSQTYHVEIEPFSYVKTFFFSINRKSCWSRE